MAETPKYEEIFHKWEEDSKKWIEIEAKKEKEKQEKAKKRKIGKIALGLVLSGALLSSNAFGVKNVERNENELDNQNPDKTNEHIIDNNEINNDEINDIDSKEVYAQNDYVENISTIDELEEEDDQYEKIIEDFEATSYCACEKCCGHHALNRPVDEFGNKIVYGARGIELKPLNANNPEQISSAAVDPSLIKLNSVFEAYDQNNQLIGTFKAEDTGSAIKNKVFDIYEGYDDEAHQRAWNRGRLKNITIKILKKEASENNIIKSTDYSIKQGDTISAIASKYDISVSEILNGNPNISNVNDLQIGQQIKIPVKN